MHKSTLIFSASCPPALWSLYSAAGAEPGVTLSCVTPGGVRGDGTHKDAGIRRTPSSPEEQSFAPCSVPRHSAPLCPATCQAGDRRPGYGTYEDIKGVRHRDPVQEGQQKGLRGGLRASVQGAELGHLPLQGCRWMRVCAGAPVEQRRNPDHREIEETKEREQQCEKSRASSSITATSPPLSSRTPSPLGARCKASPRQTRGPPGRGGGRLPPALRSASPAVSRCSAYLRRGAARLCSMLPALPPAAARGSRRGVGGAELPQFGKGRSGGPSKSGPGGVTQAQPPALRCLEGGCSCSFASAPPRPQGPECCAVLEPRSSPSARLGMGGGSCLAPPPPQTPTTLLHLCAGWKGWWIPIAMGTWHFACQPAAFRGNVGLFCWERRVAWRWEEELGLGSAGEEIPLPQMHRSQSPHQCCLHQFTREPNACLCLGGGSRTSGDTGTVMPQATSLLV